MYVASTPLAVVDLLVVQPVAPDGFVGARRVRVPLRRHSCGAHERRRVADEERVVAALVLDVRRECRERRHAPQASPPETAASCRNPLLRCEHCSPAPSLAPRLRAQQGTPAHSAALLPARRPPAASCLPGIPGTHRRRWRCNRRRSRCRTCRRPPACRRRRRWRTHRTSAIARASASVPLPNASNSNTPTGPFHTTVPACMISCGVALGGLRADVEDHVVRRRPGRPA